ncbi:hypothetical protein [Massilia sp. 9096]|uniref:hypothetical protein n=1 Tax=Massilia sp. 9096 TaxID=1500894 RepID=UPI00055B7192|nr:hypothetical protein [Massilia sp. 9096]
MQQVALVTLHGMGAQPLDYAEPLFAALRKRLAPHQIEAWISFRAVYYEDILQVNQDMVWARVKTGAQLHYDELRRFLLFGFGEAAGLENRKEIDGSVYELAQEAIARQLLDAWEHGPDAKVVFLAQSLGCQVLSSYLWDAQKAARGGPVVAGIWKDIDAWSLRALGRILLPEQKAFLRGASCAGLVTTGCNIPIFVAAHKTMDVKPIDRTLMGPGFGWLNIYDPDDALGWPLQPLSPEYAALVEDRAINAGQGMINWILKSWNPLSHLAYWTDDRVLEPLAQVMVRAVGTGEAG